MQFSLSFLSVVVLSCFSAVSRSVGSCFPLSFRFGWIQCKNRHQTHRICFFFGAIFCFSFLFFFLSFSWCFFCSCVSCFGPCRYLCRGSVLVPHLLPCFLFWFLFLCLLFSLFFFRFFLSVLFSFSFCLFCFFSLFCKLWRAERSALLLFSSLCSYIQGKQLCIYLYIV